MCRQGDGRAWLGGLQPYVAPTGTEEWDADPAVDLIRPAPSEADVAAKFVRTDLTDYGQVVAQFTEQDALFKGIDAVIHLAAIPSPEQAVSNLSSQSAETYHVAQPRHLPHQHPPDLQCSRSSQSLWYQVRRPSFIRNGIRPPTLSSQSYQATSH